MSNEGDSEGQPQLLVTVIDDDPLRARSDARELLAEVSEADPAASLRLPSARPSMGTDKGGDVVGVVGLVLSAGSFAAACVQVWLAKVPQRAIIATRPDGATLRITGREAREDEERLERFLAGGPLPTDGDAASSTPSPSGTSAAG
ncbi:effector-associated constant component EACC1 [Streptomyces sp. YS-3]|uniref:effector-associated constant component EACC1 n=1 Tax=Streptomyces sp. YS-3 TaxID=3381352 RepID=UPI00386253D8